MVDPYRNAGALHAACTLEAVEFSAGPRKVPGGSLVVKRVSYEAKLEVTTTRFRVCFTDKRRRETEQGARTFLDVRSGTIHSWDCSQSRDGKSTIIKMLLVEPARPGGYYANAGRGGKGGVRLAKTEAGEKDVGPLAAVSASSPVLELRAARGATDGLLDAFEGLVKCSVFLQKRRDIKLPSPLPQSFSPEHRNEVVKDRFTGVQLADEANWPKLTAELDALLKTHRQHTEFVYSRGARGAALERVCEVCRKKVHLGWDDRYYIGVGGARPEVHEFCLRPKPSAG